MKIIVSGGQGKGEDVSEAYAMVQYLREHEVKDEQIMLEDQSRTTRENLRFSKAYLEELKTPVGIVTNNFHLFRALLIGRSEGYENLTGIAAGCNRILFLNYMVREFFAAVWLWIQRVKKKSG
ncbi:MAG: YdcF family protein [Mediterraneibacter gnavus]